MVLQKVLVVLSELFLKAIIITVIPAAVILHQAGATPRRTAIHPAADLPEVLLAEAAVVAVSKDREGINLVSIQKLCLKH